MSKLEKLIKELCTDGVEYKTLRDVTFMERGTSLTQKSAETGKYPVISGGREPAFYCNRFNRSGETITVAGSGAGAGYVQYWNTDIFVCDAFSIKGKDFLSTKYLYYCLTNMQEKIYATKKGGGVPHVHISSIDKFSIPVPPLPVQEEIVRILDMFTQLTAELTAELTARKKQYEYYRDTLLTFDENDKSVKFVKLNDIAEYSADRIEASLLDENSYVGVDNLLPNKQGKTLSNYVPTEGRLTKFIEGDILIGNIRPYLRKVWISDIVGGTNGDVLTIHINNQNEVYPKYLYYILSSEAFFHYDTQNSKGAKMPRGDKSMVMKYELPLPSFSEQQRIVSILDRFDTLCNDITVGLPAEIEARKKQYEYYRDKLLTFKEVS